MLPELTAPVNHQCLGMSHHHPGSQPKSCGGQFNPPEGLTARPAPAPQPRLHLRLFSCLFSLLHFLPRPSCFERASGKRRARWLRWAKHLPVPIRFLTEENTFPFSRERHHCRHGPSLSLPPTPFPTTRHSSSSRGRSQRQAPHGKYPLPELWKHLDGLVRGTTRAACLSCTSSAPLQGANSRCSQLQTGAWHPLSVTGMRAPSRRVPRSKSSVFASRGRKAQGRTTPAPEARWEALGQRGGRS